jgi:hypothetical protein
MGQQRLRTHEVKITRESECYKDKSGKQPESRRNIKVLSGDKYIAENNGKDKGHQCFGAGHTEYSFTQ